MTFTVTYKANGGVGEDVVLPSQAKDAIITLQASSFTAPNGQKFSGWTVEGGDGTKFAAGSEYTVTGDVAFLAVWEPLTEQDAGATTTDMLTFIQNGTDGPTLSFTNAKIATVTFDSTQLTENVQYVLADEGKTLKLEPSYLNSQAIGTHVLTVTFQPGENGMTYGEVTRNVQISAEEKEQSNAPLMITSNWDRSSNWVHTFSAAPESGTFEIYYGKDATTGEPVYQTAKQGSDYDINGNTLTLYPDMVNGNWSTEWPNGSYQFKVDLNDNTTPTLQLTISGEAPAAPVQSSAPAQNTQNGAPVTGDDTPLVLYIVIMVVLIVALAVVLIIVIKRRNTGSGAGRH